MHVKRFPSNFLNLVPICVHLLTYFIATPPDRGWQRNEGLLLLHSFLSLDISVAFSILRFGTDVVEHVAVATDCTLDCFDKPTNSRSLIQLSQLTLAFKRAQISPYDFKTIVGISLSLFFKALHHETAGRAIHWSGIREKQHTKNASKLTNPCGPIESCPC